MKHLKTFLAFLLTGSLIAGCSSTDTTEETATEPDDSAETTETDTRTTTASDQTQIDLDELDWSVEEGEYDSETYPLFSVKNQSSSEVISFEVWFSLKSDVSEEELENAFADYMTLSGKSAEDLRDSYAVGYTLKSINPSDTSTAIPLSLDGTYLYLPSMEAYDLLEPAQASVVFLGAEDRIYIEYYDYETQTCSFADNSPLDAFTWPDTELGESISSPDVSIGIVTDSEEDSFTFTAYDVSEEMYSSYVEKLKADGFDGTSDTDSETDFSYSAQKDSIQITVSWSSDNDILYVQASIS